ncbi:MAG TPA: ABC transporter ATP-binding protein [Syntrophorhabdaceae bacterium]|nr:ABC transporter ATP-binding protein [Syntrophorhabdaceae bacterium]
MSEEVSGSKVLIAQNLTKVYSGSAEPAVKNLTIEITEREIFGLLGPNGAGKTTVISMMTTLLKPTEGSILIHGIDLLRHPKEAKKLIGYVPQDLALYPNLSARENLRFLGRVQGLSGKTLEKRVSECLDLVGLEKSADRRVYTYSGGMKRRTNLAAGILNKPRVLFLDEPTVGIDPQSRNLILERLSAMKKDTTMIYTTHYMGEVEHLCSRVAIMDFGSIIVQGTTGELMACAPGSKSLEDVFIALTGRQLRD